MTRGDRRTAPCDSIYAEERYDKAQAFALAAELDPLSESGPLRSVAVSNAVLAGVAATDVICCLSLGRRSASSNHNDAVALLRETPGRGQNAGHHLRMLLSVKYRAQYDNRNPNMSETKRALRSMRSLLRIAESFRSDKRNRNY